MGYFNHSTIVFHNGRFVKASEASTNLYSQSLHYGNAVMEGIRAYDTVQGTQIYKGQEHFERFSRSAGLVHSAMPYSPEKLLQITYELLDINQMKAAYVRPLLYSGVSMDMTPSKETNLMIAAWEWANYLGNDALNVMISSFQRLHPRSSFIEAKIAGNYVNSILATSEAKQKNYDEAIMLDAQGFVAEGSASNIFMEKNGRLYTPPKGSIMPGITRQTVIDLAEKMGIEVIEKNFTPEELKQADGAFLTATAIEITGIKSVDGQPFALPWQESIGYEIRQKYKQVVMLGEYDSYSII